jgi:hypothetical protein
LLDAFREYSHCWVVWLATGDFLNGEIMTVSETLSLVAEKKMIRGFNFGAACREKASVGSLIVALRSRWVPTGCHRWISFVR